MSHLVNENGSNQKGKVFLSKSGNIANDGWGVDSNQNEQDQCDPHAYPES